MSDLNPSTVVLLTHGTRKLGIDAECRMQNAEMDVTTVQLFIADGTGAPDQTSAPQLQMACL
jgi:hypothetical protein